MLRKESKPFLCFSRKKIKRICQINSQNLKKKFYFSLTEYYRELRKSDDFAVFLGRLTFISKYVFCVLLYFNA